MRIALGSDHAGYSLKQVIINYLQTRDIAYSDFGTFCETPIDYPDVSFPVIQGVTANEFNFGILVCGTGVGVSIVANRFQGIRAALCSDPFTARCSREHNNANILTLGSRVIGPGLALEIVEVFLGSSFQGGRHQRRLDKIGLLSAQK
ncbi:MAG TPA: ribose 5-phosphate isomerase B [Firmicutes bacterium]|nr:ribose 5-phosphate isomerase B [Bacillota bacterium]